MVKGKKIGFTSMMPTELIYCAGGIPIDLRTLFLMSHEKEKLITRAEIDGFPKYMSTWTKGIYGVVMEEKMDEIVVVMGGDSGESYALAEMFQMQGITVYPFSFPYDGDRKFLEMQMQVLSKRLGFEKMDNLDYWIFRLNDVRKLAHEIDKQTWESNKVSGYENHQYLFGTSDFEGDLDIFHTRLKSFKDELRLGKVFKQSIRLAYIGEPPLFTDIYKVIEEFDARVVFNEVQRQISMPFESKDLIDQYLRFTYPYPIFRRLVDIKKEISKRNIHGVIYNTEKTSFRQIEDIIIRKEIDLPYIMIESDGNFEVDTRTRLRLQNFIESLKSKPKSAERHDDGKFWEELKIA